MTQYIDKSAVIAEIEKRKHMCDFHHGEYWDGCYNTMEDLISFLNSLEVKEVDLNREMQAFAFLYLEPLKISDSNIGISITMAQLYRCAKHFFELGMAVSNKAQKG